MVGVELLGIATAGLVGLGVAESLAHRRRLRDIPTRIHVAGTRGKSSVTRLIAAGLRGGGIVAAAKTTGSLARMILPDARELPVFRPAGPNIIEQIRIVEAARQVEAEALVIECMALQPWLHWLSEDKLVRATHGVITNARPDHLDVMGPTDADVARCLAGMIPRNGVLVTAERKNLSILRTAAKDRNTRLIEVTDDDYAAVTDEEMDCFGHVEHRENVALSLKLLIELNIPRRVALAEMQRSPPDPGALTKWNLEFFGRQITFFNAFAANDAQSTETIWGMAQKQSPEVDRVIAIFNLRADRPSRTMQLAQTTFWRSADRIVLMGSGAYLFARVATRTGCDPASFVYAEQKRVEEVFEVIISHCGHRNLIIGMANIGGQGLALVRHFTNRATIRKDS